MTDPIPTLLARLGETARAATPGPWRADTSRINGTPETDWLVRAAAPVYATTDVLALMNAPRMAADAAHIAAASPDVVLALVAEVAVMRAALIHHCETDRYAPPAGHCCVCGWKTGHQDACVLRPDRQLGEV